MNIKQIITVGVAGMAMGAMALDNVEVTDVKARQRYPWNGKVDIDFTLDSKPTEPYQMQVEVYDNVGKTNLPVKSVCTEGISFEENPTMVREDTRRIVWDAAKDLPNGFKCTNVLVTCRDSRVNAESNRYAIVDLSAGASAMAYPVIYTNAAPTGGWTEEYMTTKLVLRRVAPSKFKMGSPLSENERNSNETRHDVALTKAYYVAVFELTEAQYLLIMGSGNSTTKPLRLDWATIRGACCAFSNEKWGYGGGGYYCTATSSDTNYAWPISKEVSDSSLVGVLRRKTGLDFDLPTEAQWEYACRFGSIVALYTGFTDTIEEREKLLEHERIDPSDSHVIYSGGDMPNAGGIHGMQDSSSEWCLDIYVNDLGDSMQIDPIGGTERINQTVYGTYDMGSARYEGAGYARVVRGGMGRSAYRTYSANIEVGPAAQGKIESVGYTAHIIPDKPIHGIRLVAPAR